MFEDEIDNWGKENFCIGCIIVVGSKMESESDEEEYQLISDYFLREFVNLFDKIRLIIVELFFGIVEFFIMGIFKKYFVKGINIFLEEIFKGKIIILDFLVKEYLVFGVYV